MFDFGPVLENADLLARGARLTVLLWLLAFAIGVGAGLPIGLARGAGRRLLDWPASLWIEVFRNTPVLVQLIWFHFAFPILTGIQPTPFASALLGLALNTSAYCAEIWRGGIFGIGRGQWDAGRALGLRPWPLLRTVILPQAVRRMLPPFTNRLVEVAKMTALASVIAVPELMYEARLMSANTYLPLEVFTVIALMYFVVIWPAMLASALLERRLAFPA
ncbi:MAG: amino acid ABC transporter permease [Acetobacteraceae bacterium]|nr:amino acid ABC transporter permease [Acetobacteraceae bacterium]